MITGATGDLEQPDEEIQQIVDDVSSCPIQKKKK
jgi:hypothetical protein